MNPYLWTIIPGIIIICWLAGDLCYYCWVMWKLHRWEASQTWDAHGIRRDCGAFEVGDATRPVAILCIHGFNDTPAVFRKMAPRLAEAGFFVRAMRLPGFGERFQQTKGYTAQDWQAAVAEELYTLRKRHTHVFVIGHSLGAAVTIACLRRDPSLADGCVLLAPALDVSRARSPLLHPETWHRVANRMLVFTNVVYSFFPNDTVDPAERRDPCATKFSWRRSHEEMFQLFRQNRLHASEFRTPTFIAIAEHDHVVDNKAIQQFLAEAASPIKEIRHYENSAHVLPLDYAWSQVTADAVAFIHRVQAHTNVDRSSVNIE